MITKNIYKIIIAAVIGTTSLVSAFALNSFNSEIDDLNIDTNALISEVEEEDNIQTNKKSRFIATLSFI